MSEEKGLFHVLLALPEEAEESLVGEEKGSERDMICLENDPGQCPRPALSLLVCAGNSSEAEQFALNVASGYGVAGGVWTFATDLADYIEQLQEQGDIPGYLEAGVLFEGECLFAVNDDGEVLKRAAEFMVEGSENQ